MVVVVLVGNEYYGIRNLALAVVVLIVGIDVGGAVVVVVVAVVVVVVVVVVWVVGYLAVCNWVVVVCGQGNPLKVY